MANYSYTRSTPLASQDPSATQPDIQQNFESINDLIDEDHVGFEQDNGGFHNQTRMLEQANIPSGTVNNSVTTYVKETSTGGSPVSQEYKTLETGGNEYQTTTLIDGSFATFGASVGWTYLPGGLILQYGKTAVTGSTDSVVFPITFSSAANVYSVTLSTQANSTSNPNPGVIFGSITASGFTYRRGNSNNTFVNWQVIGKY